MGQHASKIHPILRVLFASLIILLVVSRAAALDDNTPERREAAKDQFDRAEKARQELEARSENSRSLKDYAALVSQYKRVTLITSHAAEVPASLNEVAELYRSMGDLFDEKYYKSAIEAYQSLLREYPTSHYREEAMVAIARIEEEDLHDSVLAQKSYTEFLALHPHSAHAPEVRAALGKLNQTGPPAAAKPAPQQVAVAEKRDRTAPKTIIEDSAPPSTDTRQGSPGEIHPASGLGPQVTRIRTWSADAATRIVIDIGSQVKYQAARISGPDRIYFDLEGAKLDSTLLHSQIEVDHGGLLKSLRVAQNQADVVRVVLEVDRVKDYSVFLLPDPYRLVVDLYGTTDAAEKAVVATAPAPGPITDPPPEKTDIPSKEAASKTTAKPPEKSAPLAVATSPVKSGATEMTAHIPAESAPIPAKDVPPKSSPKDPAKKDTANVVAKVDPSAAAKGANLSDTRASSDNGGSGKMLAATASNPRDETPPSPPIVPANVKNPGKGTKSAHEQAEELGPAPIPELTREGQHSLTRALGLKVGRIVIDPGHGGHDTGTIGPTGLMEKDLCLDVSLRLGKLIELRLPGTDVIYTRSDDTFIPLEQRTAIANDAKADLFLSIHANSSQDLKARGIETYYLNFTGSSDAMEVASRENALSENGVHDLEDLVKKITRNDKIEESRDFAGIIQESLSKRMEGLNRGDRNRGVRKAPFVVLIGADMPSVLAEMSFISNPADEQWLKKPENRQRVAEGLFRGIEGYLQNTNSLANNRTNPAPENHAGPVARSGNSQ